MISRRGFADYEFLPMIAIIALLIGILLPALGKLFPAIMPWLWPFLIIMFLVLVVAMSIIKFMADIEYKKWQERQEEEREKQNEPTA